MSSYKSYKCQLCDKVSKQLEHHQKHLTTNKHKQERKIKFLEIEKLTDEDKIKEYNSTDISEIIKNLETYEEMIDCDTLIEFTLSNNDTLRDKIHDIHNYLRNSGVGYGMNALKIFNMFYGLKKIEMEGHFEKLNLDKCCKFSNILKEYVLDNEKGHENLYKKILPNLKKNKKIEYVLFYLIPKINSETILHLLNEINVLCNIEKNLNVQLSGKIYEYFIGRDESAISELGAYFTDRHLTTWIYENLLQPTLDENNNVREMIDMFGGSGGFTVGYIMYLNNLAKKNNIEIDWSKNLSNIYHYDMNEDVIKSAMLEFYCLTGIFPSKEQVKNNNSFNTNFNKKFELIVTNPPYGGDKNKKTEFVENLEFIKKVIEEYFKIKFKVRNMKATSKIKDKFSEKELKKLEQYDKIYNQLDKIKKEAESKNVNLDSCDKVYQDYAKEFNLKGNDKEAVSLIMMMQMLKENGTAVGVLKEGVFFDSKYSTLRKHLVENFNVTKIISVPDKEFENTTTKTSIIMFRNTVEKTSKIEFYDLIIDRDIKTDIKEKEDGTYRISSIKDRIIDVNGVKTGDAYSYDILENKKISFNVKDYNKKVIIPGDGFELVNFLNNSIFLKKSKFKASFGNEYGKYKFYTSSNKIKYCDEYLYNELSLIIGTGGNGSLFIDNNFSCSTDNFVIKFDNELLTKYKYYILKYSWGIIINLMNGSTIKHITKNILENLQLPIPKTDKKMKEWVNKISKPYNDKNAKQQELKDLEKEIKDRIQYISENEDCDNVELGDICEIIYGNRIVKKTNITGDIPVYGGGNITFYTNKHNREKNTLVISRYALSNECVRLIYEKFYLNDSGLSLSSNNKEYQNYINYYMLLLNIQYKIYNDNTNGSIQRNLNMDLFRKFKIKIPKNKQLITDLEPKFERVEILQEEIKNNDSLFNQYVEELGKEAIKQEN